MVSVSVVPFLVLAWWQRQLCCAINKHLSILPASGTGGCFKDVVHAWFDCIETQRPRYHKCSWENILSLSLSLSLPFAKSQQSTNWVSDSPSISNKTNHLLSAPFPGIRFVVTHTHTHTHKHMHAHMQTHNLTCHPCRELEAAAIERRAASNVGPSILTHLSNVKSRGSSCRTPS
jgi:hypothetical protein